MKTVATSSKSSSKKEIDDLKKPEKKEKEAMFGTLRVRLRRLAEQMNELHTIIKNPVVEFPVCVEPKFITNYGKNIFFCDQKGSLSIAELNDGLNVKAVLSMNIENVCGISATKKYLAVSFSSLSNEQLASAKSFYKKLDSKSGVLVFKFNDGHASLHVDKIISSSKSYNLISPSGVGVCDNNLFVCDRELHAIFKIDIKSGNLLHRLMCPEQEPVSVSVGDSKHFVYNDALKLETHLLDMDKMNVIRTVKYSDELFAEPFDVSFRENGFVFVKNQADFKIIVYDGGLNIKYSFDYEGSFKLGMHVVKLKQNFLLLGCKNAEEKDRKQNLCYKIALFSDF
jgi:WD40 repeat protein